MFQTTFHKDVLPVGRCSYDLPQPIADWMEKRQKEAVNLPSVTCDCYVRLQAEAEHSRISSQSVCSSQCSPTTNEEFWQKNDNKYYKTVQN